MAYDKEEMPLKEFDKITGEICAILEKYKLSPTWAFKVLEDVKNTVREINREHKAIERTKSLKK